MLESNIDLSLPYSSTDLPGIGGQLRASADHFVVEELPLYEPQDAGQHLFVNLTKVGLTTKEVQRQLERLFGLRQGTVGFAGMKDKHARTTQTFSLDVGAQSATLLDEAAQRIREALPVTVNWVRSHKNKLQLGHLLGNHFQITVTDLTVDNTEALQRAATIASHLKQYGVPNYFGPQRLGLEGNNIHRGLELLLGQKKVHDGWLRRFLISCYQSYLCNRYLARRTERGAFEHLLAGDVAKKYATGGMFDVSDVVAEQPRYIAQEISFTAPMYGSKMWPAQAAAGELESEILNETGITLEHWRKVRVEGTRRLGRLLLPNLQIQPAPDGLCFEFSLPKGAFATTVLREFMKVDLSSSPDIDGQED
ncbi:MAG: tRNA pseudouridine(13) synthase TruD [Chloroflexi bacterium]|nr:tRNA pseudouridine(13) synthase TruD [Chloroflexota bacterium]